MVRYQLIYHAAYSSHGVSKMKSHIKVSFFTILFSLLMLTSIAAKASTLSFMGGTAGTLPGNWNPFPAPPPLDLAVGSPIKIFDAAGEGIWLNGAANLVYTYIGKEAGSTNAFVTPSSLSGQFFITNATAPGSTINTSASSAGYLDFSFLGLGTCCVLPGKLTNGEGNSGLNGGLALAVAMIGSTKAYLMFGDGFGDSDFDDMVVKVEVSPVPVPAAIWLFGTALIGLVGFGKRRKAA
jgi:hypothetical protein